MAYCIGHPARVVVALLTVASIGGCGGMPLGPGPRDAAEAIAREGGLSPAVERAGPFTLLTFRRGLGAGDTPVDLGATEFRLMELFMSQPGRAFSREQLLDRVWGRTTYLEERTVDVHILRLRRALAVAGVEKSVETLRGVGYRFTPPK